MRPVLMRRAAAMATGLGLGGCLVVNGAFEPAGGDGSTSSSGAAVVTGSETGTSSSGASTGPDCLGEGGACVSQQIARETYLICEESGTWEQARAACEARCARLAILDEVESAELVAALRAQMTDEDIKQEQDGGDQTVWPRASWWLGGRKVNGEYLWLDGAPMPPKGTGGWYSNDPDIAGDDACAVLGVFGKGDDNGKWFDRSCKDVPYRSICEPL